MIKTKSKNKKIKNKKIRGLSNIVGSLLLIVLTIVAALLIGHFVFGLFSSNSHNAGISISDDSIIIPGGEYTTQGASVSLTITDSGNDPVVITQIVLIANGNTYTLYSGASTSSVITAQAGTYMTINGKGYLVEPGQSVSLAGTITSKLVPFLQTGQTVVIQVYGYDNVTAQSLSQQVSLVIQD
jgi:flagellin-like protein